MKRLFMTLAAVVCCAMISTVFTACSDDDDNDSADKTKAVAAIMNCKMDVSDDILAALDLTVEYYDADGKVQSEKMTKKEWEKEIRTKLPATLGARLKAKLKPDFDVTSDQKFAFAFGYSYAGYAVNSSDDVVATPHIKAGERSKTLKADEIAEWIESQPEGIVAYLYFFDASGNASAATWQ